ncbi:MAG: hypothetical protein F4X08_02265 [Gemmatimonadetes bacterium]|nr:hypothetical protein [Gemmatimonadota bacterium]MYD24619.1 hypothetical protein [Gemmatimonadota bacterium]MYI98096.1 hypothetical protein [Gemmatimonadota bacterium]
MQPVYLNHLLIFLDAETYRSIGASGFLNEHFACSEERTTHDQATDMSWTGRYYYGRETYFEFMDPARTSWAPRDAIAFGIEQEGGSEDLAGRLERAMKRDITRFKRKRRYRDQDIPWFWTVDIPRKDDARLISWVMEYDPGFLNRWAPDLPPKKPGAGTAGIARSGFLTRYRSAIGDDLPGRVFRDITSVTVTLPPDEADLLEAELGVYGYAATQIDSPTEPGADDGAGLEPGADVVAGTGPGSEVRIAADMMVDQSGTGPTGIAKRASFRGPDLDIVVEWSTRAGGPAGAGAEHAGSAAGADRTGSAATSTFGDGLGITEFSMETQPVSVTTTHTFGPACRLTLDRTGKAVWSFRKMDQYEMKT